jgi:hypothetical protein
MLSKFSETIPLIHVMEQPTDFSTGEARVVSTVFNVESDNCSRHPSRIVEVDMT